MLVSSLLALGQLCAAPQTFGQDTDRFRPSTVQDLAYGEVLFHFYREDYFTALTQLLVAQARDEFSYHDGEAELLLGGLYLSYGLHRHAGEIFNRLLEQSVEPSLHDRAWFFLAKIWYQRGYLERSEQALARIGTSLPAELQSERHMLEARVLMSQGSFDEALAVLSRWEDPGDEWVGYAKYNIGVSLVRLGRIEDGARVLDEVGQLPATNANRTGLRDKANVALGYAWLQAERPDRAQPLLQRVRLQGPFSNKALLGVGWSDAERGDYRAALSPWLELRQRNIIDPAVQESLLAVPSAGLDGKPLPLRGCGLERVSGRP
jgi:tetratricopeptide (TPR) repeat protein